MRRASGIVFRFDRQDRQSHANSHTFYLAYEGPLPAGGPTQVKVDITIREQLIRPVAIVPVVRGYEEYADLPDDAEVRAYSLEEIAVEKVVALGDRARNEPRDLYDIWYLTTGGHVDLENLRGEVEAKLAFRGRKPDELAIEFKKKEARLEALWSKRLAAQMTELPEFQGVFRAVQRAMRQAELLG